ncbi:MAG TPA: FAD-dependent oxidoreductase [Firmicutes bacterium]|nr:FAD-dependent oxidoreductase [Bacillota bacterium]
MVDKRFRKLFEPIRIGPLTVKNRIMMPSMCCNYAGPNGETTEQDIGYFEARARGGCGLVTIDYACVSPEGRGMPGQRGIWGNQFIPALSRLADAIKAHGATTCIQLHHGGLNAQPELVGQPVAPSRLSNARFFVTEPRELSTEEVEELVEKFAAAALRAKQAGIECVEVHGTHGYLVCQFLSPFTNMRTDKYGRDRKLFAIEVVRRIKERCGEGYPVIFRLDADEFLERGITLEYAKEIARALEGAGVDMFSVTGGCYDTINYCLPPLYLEDEQEKEFYHFVGLAAEIKKVVHVPVCSGGLVSDPFVAERILEQGLVDMLFVGRQLMADPEWPNKVREGRIEDIRPCMACNEGCIGRIFGNQAAWCAVNPLMGYEYRWGDEYGLPRAVKRRKVLVVGAGPAGLEAARIAAIRGHQVVLVDRCDRVGGALNVAAVPSFKKRYPALVRWYEKQVRDLGVDVRLNTQVTPEMIEREAPDAVVAAVGGEPLVPGVRGIEKAVLADDVLLGKKTVGQRVVVMGGGLVGLETALYLAKQGKSCTVVEALPEIGRDMEPTAQLTVLGPGGLLAKYGISVITRRPVIEVTDQGVVVVDELGRTSTVSADSVVCALGRKPADVAPLVEKAREVGAEVWVIGDAKSARKAIDAIHEGFNVGRNL